MGVCPGRAAASQVRAHGDPCGPDAEHDRGDDRPQRFARGLGDPVSGRLRHSEAEAYLACRSLPGGQGEHSDWAARLVALLKEPLSHGSGAEAPGGQMEPGSHGWQEVALGED